MIAMRDESIEEREPARRARPKPLLRDFAGGAAWLGVPAGSGSLDAVSRNTEHFDRPSGLTILGCTHGPRLLDILNRSGH